MMVHHMLKISSEMSGDVVRLVLEGSFSGPWVAEFETVWQRTSTGQKSRGVRVDLSGVTDQFEINALKALDQYIARMGLNAPAEAVPRLRDGYTQEMITKLDLKASGIPAIIWATGYSFDFSFVKLPVVDSDGYPIHKRGVTDYDGLYFLGMPWLHGRRSGILFGVGDDAA